MIAVGLGIAFLGLIFYIGAKAGIGRLPGDIYIRKGNFTFYFPIVTCILLSIILTFVFRFIRK
ncbi:MAG: DUF2905 domain-containing protein [Caulobacteraceae bacterium]